MKIAFIGMSGCGKTYWSSKIHKLGYSLIGCDAQIGKKLSGEMAELTRSSGTEDVSRWMGQPFESQYAKHSRMYLYYENEVMQEVISFVEHSSDVANIVVDTTGSLVYVKKSILQKLKKQLTFVYLKSPQSRIKTMIQQYFDDPKPIIWGDFYVKNSVESNIESIKRCYPSMLEYRSRIYESLADVTLDVDKLSDNTITAETVLKMISLD